MDFVFSKSYHQICFLFSGNWQTKTEQKSDHFYLWVEDYSETMIEEANKKLLGVSDIRAVIRKRREDKKPSGNYQFIC